MRMNFQIIGYLILLFIIIVLCVIMSLLPVPENLDINFYGIYISGIIVGGLAVIVHFMNKKKKIDTKIMPFLKIILFSGIFSLFIVSFFYFNNLFYQYASDPDEIVFDRMGIYESAYIVYSRMGWFLKYSYLFILVSIGLILFFNIREKDDPKYSITFPAITSGFGLLYKLINQDPIVNFYSALPMGITFEIFTYIGYIGSGIGIVAFLLFRYKPDIKDGIKFASQGLKLFSDGIITFIIMSNLYYDGISTGVYILDICIFLTIVTDDLVALFVHIEKSEKIRNLSFSNQKMNYFTMLGSLGIFIGLPMVFSLLFFKEFALSNIISALSLFLFLILTLIPYLILVIIPFISRSIAKHNKNQKITIVLIIVYFSILVSMIVLSVIGFWIMVFGAFLLLLFAQSVFKPSSSNRYEI